MQRSLLRSLVLLTAAILMLAMYRTAHADIIIGSCTIISNPTADHFTNCPNANLNAADLSGGVKLSFASFSGANLSDADMSNSIGNDINLSGANQAGGPSYSAGAWSNQNVTVHFACSTTAADRTIATCAADQSYTTDVNATAHGRATDDAGFFSDTGFGPIRINKTAPAITAGATRSDNTPYRAGAWTDQDVTVSFACADSPHALTYAVVNQPGHGTLTGTPPAVTYTPAADFNGADSFTFRANDGQFNSNLAGDRSQGQERTSGWGSVT